MSSQLTGASTEAALTDVKTATAPPPLRRRSKIETWLFLIPALVFQLTWGWYPLVMGIIISFTDGQVVRPSKFVGLDNYLHMVTDPIAIDAFRITFTYGFLSVVLTFAIPILAAIFIMEMPRRVTYIMMFLWFLPLSSITSIMLLKYFYDPSYGLFQFVAVNILHLPPQQFLANPGQVLFWLVFPGIIFFAPGLLYMASVQSIPSSYYEAAEVEGAGLWRKIWTITLPRLRPVIHLTLLLAILTSLQLFDMPQILTQGGPVGQSTTIIIYVYNLLGNLRYGDAAALTCLSFVVSFIILVLFRTVIKEDPDA